MSLLTCVIFFRPSCLGLPLIAETRKLDQLTPASIAEFMKDNVSASRVVLAAANVPHDELVKLAEVNFAALPSDAVVSDAPALYTGGSIRLSGDGPGHVAMGFKGVSWSDEDLIPVCILHALLGGGGSFSSGGPGKGMYTRLFADILSRHGWISSAVAFNHCYSDSGVFGIHASCADPAQLNNLIEVVGTQVGKMVGPISGEEMGRAKAMTKSSLLMNLESRAVVCEDIGRQILGSGKYVGAAELSSAIDKVDESDLRRVAAKMLESKPSLVIHGEEVSGSTSQEDFNSFLLFCTAPNFASSLSFFLPYFLFNPRIVLDARIRNHRRFYQGTDCGGLVHPFFFVNQKQNSEFTVSYYAAVLKWSSGFSCAHAAIQAIDVMLTTATV